MSGLVFRLWVDSGASAVVCWITRHHKTRTSSSRHESCVRCPMIRVRRDLR